MDTLEKLRRISAIISISSVIIIFECMIMSMYYFPFGAGVIPGITSPDLEAARRAFQVLGYTRYCLLISVITTLFVMFTEPMQSGCGNNGS